MKSTDVNSTISSPNPSVPLDLTGETRLYLGDVAVIAPATPRPVPTSPAPAGVVVPARFAAEFVRAARLYRRSTRRVRWRALAERRAAVTCPIGPARLRASARHAAAVEQHLLAEDSLATLIRSLTGDRRVVASDYQAHGCGPASNFWATVELGGLSYTLQADDPSGAWVEVQPLGLTVRL